MRHGKKFNHLSRTNSHRKAMLANMATSLIDHKRIVTTVAKAKALRKYVEPLITKAKDDTTHSRRTVFKYLQNKESVNELFRNIAAKIADRPGGYTRILKMEARQGDSAEMAMIELVDYNENMLSEKASAAKKTRRGRRGTAKASGESKQTADQPKEVIKEAPKAKEEAPKAEAKEEAPKVEPKEAKAETPKAVAKEETPKAPVKEEAPKAEAAAEKEPQKEAKSETPKAETKEENKESKEDKKDS